MPQLTRLQLSNFLQNIKSQVINQNFNSTNVYILNELQIFNKFKIIFMSQQYQPKQADLVKVLERENVISYKKKAKPVKDIMKSHNNNEDEDNVSAQSLQSGVYSEDVSRMKGKMNPLPELGKQKKRFITKNLLTQQLRINNYQEKEVRQHDNLMLKQKNNFLSSENMKLKTKISTLEKQNFKLQKLIDEEPLKVKTPGLANLTKQRFRPSGQNMSTKILMKNLKKQLQDLRKQNTNIKSSIKFTTISELQCERDAIMQETNRLRMMLQEQQSRRISFKIKQHGMSNMEQKFISLQDKYSIVVRQNNELKNRAKIYDESQNKIGKANESEKNLNKVLYNVRRLLKQKQREVEQLRQQIKTAGSLHSIALTSDKSINGYNITSQQMPNQKKPSVERPSPGTRNFQKRVISKSSQKTNTKLSDKSISDGKCENCKKLKLEIQGLKKKIAEYESQFQTANPLTLPVDPVEKPSSQQIQALIRYVEFRFKAHHLSLAESQKYLLNAENINEEQLKKQVTIQQFLQSVVTEPFVILNKRYIEVFLIQICYVEEKIKGSAKIKIDKATKITKKMILQNYKKLMPPYELLAQPKQQQMFLQIAQLVTSYYQQILAAMSNRKNGEGTISEKEMAQFFTEIQLEKEYIDFIITQIILQSIDLERLNYFAFFQIFYMPHEDGQSQQGPAGKKPSAGPLAAIDKKKRFQVDHVVKEEDEEYEQSRSYVDASRQKTISKHGQSFNDSHNQPQDEEQSPYKRQQQNEQQNYDQQQQQQNQGQEEKQTPKKPQKQIKKPQNILKKVVSKEKPKDQAKRQKSKKKKTQKQDSYAEEFQQQKVNSDIEQDQAEREMQGKKQAQKLIEKPYQIQDIEDEYNEEFQN